jgi:hypothetical protein
VHKDKLKSTDAKATEDERKLGLWKKKRKSNVIVTERFSSLSREARVTLPIHTAEKGHHDACGQA